MIPSSLVIRNCDMRIFGQIMNEKKHKMRGGYKKRGRKK